MDWTVDVAGLNLEKLLTMAAKEGIVLRDARRLDARTMRVRVQAQQKKALLALCDRFGWEMRTAARSPGLRLMALLRRRPMILAAGALFFALVMLSSRMIWQIDVQNAGKAVGEVRAYLDEADIRPGALKSSISLGGLKQALELRLPDLAFAGVSFEGSTLVIDCQSALEGEQALLGGEGLDLVASEDGVITRIAVHSGTPLVKVGQAVRRGDVLVRGEERGEKASVHPIQAQAEIRARVWARGDARVARQTSRTVETGQIRRRVTLHTPWNTRVVRDAQPFAQQDASTEIQQVVGLFLPVWREIETYAEIEIVSQTRSEADAASIAQGAAQQMAKLKCPSGAEILDKWVDYSMIDNEFVCATVVLEYEQDIAVRAGDIKAQ